MDNLSEQIVDITTTEEKALIAERMVLHVPGGELKSVLSDLRVMLGSDATNPYILQAIKMASQYHHEKQLTSILIPGQQRSCLITPYNNVEDSVYFDLIGNKTFNFDPISGEVSNVSVQPLNFRFDNEVLNKLWYHLDESCITYIDSRYPSANSSIFVVSVKSILNKYKGKHIWLEKHKVCAIDNNNDGSNNDDDDIDFDKEILECVELLYKSWDRRSCEINKSHEHLSHTIHESNLSIFNFPNNLNSIAICMESHNYQSQNYWTGNWTSQWMIIPISHDQCRLLGIVSVHVHYFEDSNIQLRSKKCFKHDFNNSSMTPATFAAEVFKFISQSEDAYQAYINNSQSTMSEQILKSLRRQLPVTKSKINWDVLICYRDMRKLNNLEQSSDPHRSS